ncbi:MAG: hypothetical protein FJZ16_09335, partial [Candidatus Omnitrophica bacterium]|nr:hypothetical protein [Candidatus Omnitrophota bacterium]
MERKHKKSHGSCAKTMNIEYYLYKLKEYPLHIVIRIVLRKAYLTLRNKLRSMQAGISSNFISDDNLLKSLKDSYNSIEHILKKERHVFFIQSSEKNKMIEILKINYPTAVKETIFDAERICKHIFNLLGSGDICLGEKLDWHTDFKTNWSWPLLFYKKLDCRRSDNPSDVKVPWELSRCQHFITLGKAYWYTGDEKYAKEFVSEIKEWMDSNPPMYGVNWVCTMDVAIRVINWIWGYYFFKDSPVLTRDFMMNFLKFVLVHGRHIMNNLEKSEKSGNHYLSNLSGLICIGVAFPEFKESKKWRDFGFNELIKEMNKQVYIDGISYEGSIYYHQLVTELFLFSTLLCLNNSSLFISNHNCQISNYEFFPFPKWYIQRLEKMIEFIMYYSKPDKSAPRIGDNDDGRLYILCNYSDY